MELRDNEIYTIEEAAQILKVSQTTIRRKIRSGELRSNRLGRLHRIRGEELFKLFLDTGEEGGRKSATAGK
ncbi:MAG: helix-turn-helix domain-containing protein [Thermodesulfobacteriota bacterium]|nr:helix-turn-helix domain-containing protein [Thermodesulfobacteriota bacterium]MDQ7839173.1 helix-turn-helix domain-containing protein [Thermodesulfobacteriota bacterium]